MLELRQQIADLEGDLEQLSDAAERCRKAIVVAKVVAAAGGLLLLMFISGLFRLEPQVLVVGIAGVLGGIAFYGSNRGTLDEIKATMKSYEARRNAMIGELELLAVEP